MAVSVRPNDTVFIVDDDDSVRDSVRAMLEAYDFEVADFRSGSEFLEHCRPDTSGCVVLDINMPGVDGFGVLNRIGRRPTLPVLMITARGDAGVAARATACGAAGFLEKPFIGERLIEEIRRVMPH